MQRNGLCAHSFAIKYKMTPSTVTRALGSREAASWTPAFQDIYRIAVNMPESSPNLDLQLLTSYQGPGEAIVRRMLTDFEELVRTLSK